MQFASSDLTTLLVSPAWQLTVLAIMGTASLEVAVAVWAAVSRWHWFFRVLVLWGAIAALVPIRAYEPALLFAISSPLTVAAICGCKAIAARRNLASATSIDTHPPLAPLAVRFGLLDLLLLLAVIGLSLVVLIRIMEQVQPIEWVSLAGYVAALILLGIASWVVVFAQLPPIWMLGLAIGAIAATTFIVWSSDDWLEVGLQLGVNVPLFGEARWLKESLTAEVLLVYCFMLLLFRLATVDQHSLWRWFVRLGLIAIAIAFLGLWTPIYFQMLWLTPMPPTVVGQPNHYHRIMSIAKDVAASKQDEQSLAELLAANPDPQVVDHLKTLYDELLPLLDAPNAIVPPPIRDNDDTSGLTWSMDSLQPGRSLGLSLNAEAKVAAANGDLDRALTWSLANLRLGGMFSRGAMSVQYSLGIFVEQELGAAHLAELRTLLSPTQSRVVIAALARVLEEHESPEAVYQRETAYWERWYGWNGRLEKIIENMQGQHVGKALSSAHLRRLAFHRLLQADLAIRLFSHDEKRLPQSLNDVVPNYLFVVPIDPYTDEPLRYLPSDEGFLLYSVGLDRTDDGGRFGNAVQYHRRSGYDLDLDLWARK